MRVILGGKFENALIHEVDAVNHPERNTTGHHYYLGLNRKPDRFFFERAATFLAIADATIVPVADWSGAPASEKLSGESLGLLTQQSLHNEWAPEARKYAEFLLAENVLSENCVKYISALNLDHVSFDFNSMPDDKKHKLKSDVSIHYLCRLFLQIRESGENMYFLVLDEEDINIISEIGEYIKNGGVHPDFRFPDLEARVIFGERFAGGLFNFAPIDAVSVAAIRSDPEIQNYAKKVRTFFVDPMAPIERERELTQAMRQSADGIRTTERIQSVFEVINWVAKPLHYIPGVDAVLSVAEDVIDVADKLFDDGAKMHKWYLLAARATEVSIEEYLQRRENL